MSCLRGKSVAEILNAQEKMKPSSENVLSMVEVWEPVIDRVNVFTQPKDAMEKYGEENNSTDSGSLRRRPILWGTTSEEGLLFVLNFITVSIPSFFYHFGLGKILKKTLDQRAILNLYPAVHPMDAREDLAVVVSDMLFRCPRRFSMNHWSSHGHDKLWAYTWGRRLPVDIKSGFYAVCSHRVCHGTELAFLFQTILTANQSVDPRDVIISQQLIDYYASFIRHGDPNIRSSESDVSHGTREVTSALPHWPKIKENGGLFRQMVFRDNWRLSVSEQGVGFQENMEGTSDPRCDLWDAGGYK